MRVSFTSAADVTSYAVTMLSTSPPWCLRANSGNVMRRAALAVDAVDDVDELVDDVRDTGTLDVVDIIRRKTEKLIVRCFDDAF
jgi:hypothetical protein